MELKDRIKKIRSDAGLTQKEFGEKIGVGRIYVSGWETNQSEPGKARLFVIAEKFHVNIDWLTTGEGEPYVDKSVDAETRREIEFEYIKKLFTALPSELQTQILAALREMVATGSTTPRLINNHIDVHGTINGDVSINTKEGEK